MSFQEELKASRGRAGYTQNILAAKVGVSQSNWSKYESGEAPIPADIALRAIDILKDSRLKTVFQHENKLGVLNMPILTGVDENPYTVLNVVIEEAEELLSNAESLKKMIRNKKDGSGFTESEWQRIFVYEEQICDVVLAINTHLIRMQEVYGLDLNRLEKRMLLKLENKKYV
jgi:transcriptional regulator with XRE-family HTH domain